MRIVAGKFRRRKLEANPGNTTRPITDRAKEVVFERLHNDIEGKRVADIFAGTGTIGLESLSRGALSAVFIEKDHKAFELLEKNVTKIADEGTTFCWRTDVLKSSFRPKGIPELLPFDTIFFDPPYRMIEGMRPGSPIYKSLQRLAREDVSSERSLLVLRTPRRAEFECPPEWQLDRVLDLKSMLIHLFDKAQPQAETDEIGNADLP